MRTFLETIFAHSLLAVLGVVPLLIALQLFRTYWRLRHIPGPFWASFTNIPRVLWVKTKQAHLIHQRVHEQYGPVVRTGPNMVMFDDPDAIPIVHTMRRGFPKAPFYDIFKSYTPNGGAVTVFNATDEDALRKIKSPVAPFFSATNAMAFEPIVDEVLECFVKNVNRRYLQHGTIFDLAKWLQYYAFDVMGMLTFSKRYSFLDEGEDVGGMLGAIYTYMENAAPLTQMPWADKLLFKNWLAHAIRRVPSLPILKVVANAVQERQELMEKGVRFSGRPDFLAKFMQLAHENPELPPGIVSNWTFTNVIAGSDSVGIVMTTMMYHLLQNPNSMQKLHAELRSANLSRPHARLGEIQGLPYLDACMWESVRLHPAFALPFERVVPEGGITIGDHHLPAGTWVGGSPYVVNRHKKTFGADAEFWRPERWLEGDEKHKNRLQQSTLTFGAGFRICIGRHIGIVEIKKMISLLVLHYDIQIIDPKLLQVENWWLFKQEGFYVRMEKRAESIIS
ncbi:cytochrome P450 [Diplogelasinospora grovesii]|uniref:Cytochrome P450 n=1 Tax=Diplogelasinospora grovesii TaxID=303347 RepID=A0AAN6NGF8_9PEZI|nr:cytochrome P450 [Diplogelasinospora grovesii]